MENSIKIDKKTIYTVNGREFNSIEEAQAFAEEVESQNIPLPQKLEGMPAFLPGQDPEPFIAINSGYDWYVIRNDEDVNNLAKVATTMYADKYSLKYITIGVDVRHAAKASGNFPFVIGLSKHQNKNLVTQHQLTAHINMTEVEIAKIRKVFLDAGVELEDFPF